MDATRSREQVRAASVAAEPGDHIFRKYYTDKDYISSLEGVLKVLSAMACVVSAVLFAGWAACPAAPALAPSAAVASLACGAACALLFGGVVLDLPLKAPQPYLLTDIIVSTVTGLSLLVTAVLSMTVCEFYSVISFFHGPLAVLNAGMVIASAVITYVAVMRLWDTASHSGAPPRPLCASPRPLCASLRPTCASPRPPFASSRPPFALPAEHDA